MATTTGTTQISTIAELKAQEELVRAELRTEQKELRRQWDSLFRRGRKGPKTPTERALGFFSKGSSLLDGAILGWKLYKKFKR